MSKKIQTYSDLIDEKQRLETLLSVQKHEMRANWDSVKLELAPVQNVFTFIGKFFKRDRSNPMLTYGINFAGNIFLKKFLLAKADWVSRLILPIFIKNYSSHLLTGEKAHSIIGKIKSLFRRKRSTPESMQY